MLFNVHWIKLSVIDNVETVGSCTATTIHAIFCTSRTNVSVFKKPKNPKNRWKRLWLIYLLNVNNID